MAHKTNCWSSPASENEKPLRGSLILGLVGCWLGGSAGFQCSELGEYYGDRIPKRDIGYLASEASITIPCEDNTPAGILALHNNFYEFVPEGQEETSSTETLKAHELEQGSRYNIILTNWNGLYRYNIHDIIEVHDFYNKTPIIAFARKSKDMLNITGEKLHVNHFLKVFDKVNNEHNLPITQFKAVPNYKAMRYEILMHVPNTISDDFLRETILPFIDTSLSRCNIEYAMKRKSGRLNPPCLYMMKPSWKENTCRHLANERTDIQHKWRAVATEISTMDREHIHHTIEERQ